MQLDTFISETLKAIVKGVKDSQEFAHEKGARINPVRVRAREGTYVFYGDEDGYRALSKIEFDIAVTVSSQQETGANAGIKVYALNIGGKKADTDLNETVSRIKFDIEVALPNVKP
jgi:hypothetical protein